MDQTAFLQRDFDNVTQPSDREEKRMAYRFKRKESIPEGVRRIVVEESAKAARELGGDNPDIHDGVHNARKCFKKIRSTLRLVRGELGKQVYRRENGWFRDAGRRLSAVRDAEAMIETYDQLTERYPDISEFPSLRALRESLVQRRERIATDEQDLEERARALARELEEVPSRAADWPLAHKGFAALAPGLELSYRRGRKALKQAYRDPTDERFHEWRKRVKDHWYQCRLLRRSWPEFMESRISELKDLADLLGDDHDLAVLQQTLVSEGEKLEGNAHLLRCLGGQRQDELRRQARDLGRKVYEAPPSALVDEIADHWKSWKTG
jgi:CHAD domain-containing protein